MRKSQYFIFLILVGFLCAVWSPWNNWDINLSVIFGVQPPPEVAGLQVTSLAGEMIVKVDGENKGTVSPESSPLAIPGIKPGEHEISLQRKSSVNKAYWEFNRLLEFHSGVDIVVAYELGPTQKFSEGHIIKPTPSSRRDDTTLLNITTSPPNSQVQLDGASIGDSPVESYELGINDQHKLAINKDGYDTQEFVLLPDTQVDRDKLNGYDINVEANLFLQPLKVN